LAIQNGKLPFGNQWPANSGKSLNQMELPMGKFIGRFGGVMGVPIMVLSASSLNHVETHDYWPHAQSLIQLFN